MPVNIKRFLEEITRVKSPGPSPTFSVFQMLRAIELIGEKEKGRGKLAELLNVGEGAVRTIIGRLKSADLIETSKSGCSLTDKGLRLLNEYKQVFREKGELGKFELTASDYSFAILAKNRGDMVKSGMEQRDAAVKMGADAAVIIVSRRKRLVIPSVSDDLEKDFPKAARRILKLMRPEENDVVVVAGADSLDVAEYGALAAAWTLLN
jgi:predicted transcriptional regulator